MRTLLLVTLYLSLTNVASMRRIENRVSCKKKKKKKKKKKLSIRFSYSLCYRAVWMENRKEKNKQRSFLQIPGCNQETALKVLQHCRDCFALPGVFVVKQR